MKWFKNLFKSPFEEFVEEFDFGYDVKNNEEMRNILLSDLNSPITKLRYIDFMRKNDTIFKDTQKKIKKQKENK